jgi:putative endonuclease
LEQRIVEHYLARGSQKTFAGKYHCYWLLYHEDYTYVEHAIAREKEVKKWNRFKKERLLQEVNPQWKFLNFELYNTWPPLDLYHRKDL